MDFIDSNDNLKIAHECMSHGSACCKKGKLFLTPFEYERIVTYLKTHDMDADLEEWLSRCENRGGYYLYDQKEGCQFLDSKNLCRIHFSGVEPNECFWWPLHVFYDEEGGYCLKAGTYCCDACNFIKPDSEHTKMVENQAKHIGLELFKKFRETFPGNGAYRFVKKIDTTPRSQVVGSEDFPVMRGAFRSLGAQFFGDDLLYPEENVAFANSPSHFFAGFVQDGKLLSCSDVVLVSTEEFQKFKEGRLDEDKLYGGNLWTSEAYIYVNTLILGDEYHIPFLYRRMFKEIQKFCDEHEVRVKYVFAMSTNEKIHQLLLNGRFEEVGKYKDKYPIMLLDRKKNSMIHSMLPTWEYNKDKLQ